MRASSTRQRKVLVAKNRLDLWSRKIKGPETFLVGNGGVKKLDIRCKDE